MPLGFMFSTALLAQPRVRCALGSCLLIAFYLGAGVFDHELWAPTEPTMAGVVWEMFRNGDLLVPHINGIAYLEKPPLAYLLSWFGFELNGAPSAGLLRLPAALAGIGCVLTVFSVARRLYDEPTAWLCALLCALTANFWSITHRASTDAPVMFCIFLALALFTYTLPPPQRNGSSSPQPVRLTWYTDAGWCITLAISFLIKNFFAYLFVVPPVVLLLLSMRSYRRLALSMLWLIGTWLILVGPWCAALYVAGGADYLRVVFFDNTLGRFMTLAPPPEALLNPLNDAFFVHKTNGPTILLTAFPAQMVPWILLQPIALWSFVRSRPRESWQKFLLVTLYCIVFFLTLSASRTESYFRPLVFCLCLISGDFLFNAYSTPSQSRTRDRRIVMGSWVICALALIALPAIVAHVADARWLNWVGAFNAACCASAIAASRGRWSRRETALAWGIGCAVLAATTLGAVMRPIDDVRSLRPFFVQVAEKLNERDEVATTEVNDRMLPVMNYYLDRRLEVISASDVPERLASQLDFAVILSRENFDALAPTLSNPRYRTMHAGAGDSFVYVDNGPCRYRLSRAPTGLVGRSDHIERAGRVGRADRMKRPMGSQLSRRCDRGAASTTGR